MRRALWALGLSALLLVSHHTAAQAGDDDAPMCVDRAIPIARELRQLTLDLLGRPPTMDEYRAVEAAGQIAPEQRDAMLDDEQFYARMKRYHRALLRANVSASVRSNGDTRLVPTTDGQKPLEVHGNAAAGLRGRNGVGCDHFIPQDDCKNPALAQDPHAEGPAAQKQCRDDDGVPLPVSFDYDTNLYACTALTGASSCTDAVQKGLLDDALLYFCDMRRSAAGLAPSLCLPDPGKPTTGALTERELDDAGHVVAFLDSTPAQGAAFARLERCTLGLGLKNGIRGSYVAQRGCIAREGVVMAPAPYWDTSGAGQVASCAIEAQDRATNPGTLASCEGGNFIFDRSCGCGARFRRCEPDDQSVFRARVEAINEEPLRITDAVLRNDEDYYAILTTRRSFVNGVLSSLYRERMAPGMLEVTAPAELSALPSLRYGDDPATWVEIVRDERAAGVLTTPAYLYRFPTQRARVSEFYDAFLCKPFAPPADAVAPPPEDACNRENDLSKRCGCAYCHATIEPTGAHWGRFGERSALYLDSEHYPKLDPKCRDCALAGNTGCDGACGQYVMQAYDGDGASSLGMLKGYLYRTPEDQPNIDAGPRLLVSRMLQTGDLERCTVTRIWAEFLGRPMSSAERDLYMDALVNGFVADGHNLKSLVRRVIGTDAYRRID